MECAPCAGVVAAECRDEFGVGVDPVIGEGGDHLAYYLIEEPDGSTLFVDDLDEYFQRVLRWEAL